MDVAEGESGEHLFQFSASVIGGSNPRFRYVVNGVPSETTTYGSLRGDAIIRTDDGWSSVTLPRSLNLSAGRHVVQVEVWNDSTTASLDVRNVFLQSLGSSTINGQPAFTVQSVQNNVFTQQNVAVANGWTTVSSLTTTVDATKTGEYVLTFATSALGGSHTGVRYLINGVPSAVGGTFLGSNTFTYTQPGWATLDLTRELNLSPGTHTIQVQVRTDLGTVGLRNSFMQLLGYNKIDGQPTATIESVEDVTSRTLIPSTNGFTTVTSLTTTVDAQKTGDYLLSFGAVGQVHRLDL